MSDKDRYTKILYKIAPEEDPKTRSGSCPVQTALLAWRQRMRGLHSCDFKIPCYRTTYMDRVSCRRTWQQELGYDTKVSLSCFQPSQMKFFQQLVSKKNSKQSSSKHATSSPTERRPLETAVAVLETEPPKISLDDVADNLPQLDDDTLLCILQALTSPVALTKARMVSLLVGPHHLPHRLTVSPSDLQAAIRLWRRENPMGALGTRTVRTGAAPGLAQARYPARRQRRTATAGRPEISPITQEYMLETVANSPDCQCPAGTVSACPSVVCAEVAHY